MNAQVTQNQLDTLNQSVANKVEAWIADTPDKLGLSLSYRQRSDPAGNLKVGTIVLTQHGEYGAYEYDRFTAYILDTDTGQFLKGRALKKGTVKLTKAQPKAPQSIDDYQLDCLGCIDGYVKHKPITVVRSVTT